MAGIPGKIHRAGSESSIASFSDHIGSVQTEINGKLEESVEYVLQDPISSGFLLSFCDSHYCSENMRFLIEIDRFKDQFMRDKKAWDRKKNFLNYDAELGIIKPEIEEVDLEGLFMSQLNSPDFIPVETWPSDLINRESIREYLVRIFNMFIVNDAKYWICMPHSCLVNTLKRIKHIHVYGREVFGETVIDPIKTIRRDIFPRFIVSEQYKLLSTYKSSLDHLPQGNKLRLTKPNYVILQRYALAEIITKSVKFTLADFIDDRFLYSEFNKYLEKIVSCENLYCVRAIRVYKELYKNYLTMAQGGASSGPGKDYAPDGKSISVKTSTTGTLRGDFNSTKNNLYKVIPTANRIQLEEHRRIILEYAWNIFKFFVAPGSAFEISVAYRIKKEVMRTLANPQLHTFDNIERSAYSSLKVHYSSFVNTKEYTALYDSILKNKHLFDNKVLESSESVKNITNLLAGSAPIAPAAPVVHGMSVKEKRLPPIQSKAPAAFSCFPKLK